MPLTGEYEPSAVGWARDQVDIYERSGGSEGTGLRGRPVIILTDYAEYQKNTTRTIPVFVLTPVDA
jgi:hypothetical protein